MRAAGCGCRVCGCSGAVFLRVYVYFRLVGFWSCLFSPYSFFSIRVLEMFQYANRIRTSVLGNHAQVPPSFLLPSRAPPPPPECRDPSGRIYCFITTVVFFPPRASLLVFSQNPFDPSCCGKLPSLPLASSMFLLSATLPFPKFSSFPRLLFFRVSVPFASLHRRVNDDILLNFPSSPSLRNSPKVFCLVPLLVFFPPPSARTCTAFSNA